jgi:hypothetical protein
MKTKRRQSTQEIIRRLRQPAAVRAQEAAKKAQEAAVAESEAKVLGGFVRKRDLPLVIIGVSCLGLIMLTMFFYLMAKNRAEDMVAALEPGQVEGLTVEDSEFNPNTGVTYVQVSEGQDRNVTNVSNAGASLPTISRFNLKTFTEDNYKMIGMAPWALTTNFSANINDPALMRMLLDNEAMIQAFLARADVAPLLDDPQMLIAFAKDEHEMSDFLNNETVQQVLASEQMVRTFLGSRFAGYLLISKSAKYLRSHPQEAIAIIDASYSLNALRSNEGVRKAVEENPKLKSLAAKLLAAPAVAPAAPVAPQEKTDKNSKKKKSSSKKKK